MKRTVVLFCMVFIFAGCSSTKTSTIAETTTKSLDDLIINKSFEVISDWAQPQVTNAMVQLGNAGLFPPGSNAGMINLQGNTNYLVMKDGKVTGYLPFYGERQIGGAYNSNHTGIEFDGVPKNLKIERKKRGTYLVKFDINDKNIPTENYRIFLELFPSLSSSLTINSSQRTSIQYKGRAKVLESDDES